MNDNKYRISSEGYKSLQEELKQLIIEKKQAEENLNAARALGDLSENSDYDTAKEAYARISGRMNEVNDILDHAIIDDGPIDNSIVSVGGGYVTIERTSDGKEFRFRIVGENEPNLLKDPSLISNVTPVAKAILDHKVDDICEVKVAKPYSVRIKLIEEK